MPRSAFEWLGLGQGGPACEEVLVRCRPGEDPDFEKEVSTETEVRWTLDAVVISEEL